MVDKIVAAHGPEALRDLPAIALGVTVSSDADLHTDDAVLGRHVTIEPIAHPLLEAQLELTPATRRGRFTWMVGKGDLFDSRPFQVVFDQAVAGTVQSGAFLKTTRGPRNMFDTNAYQGFQHLEALLRGGPASPLISHQVSRTRWDRLARTEFPRTGAARFGAVSISDAGTAMYITIVTHQLELPDSWEGTRIPLNLRAAGRSPVEPRAFRAAEVAEVVRWARKEGLTVVDLSDRAHAWKTLEQRCDTSLIAWPAQGAPALARVHVGSTAPSSALIASGTSGTITAEELDGICSEYPVAVVDGRLTDLGRILTAEPHDDERLFPYQAQIVGRHLATEFGFANTIEPGMGKTITTLVALGERAKRIRGWRGLVVTEANVRDQWAGEDSEADTWLPDVRRVVVSSRADTPKLAAALAESGDEPLLVVTSYSLACDILIGLDPGDKVAGELEVPAEYAAFVPDTEELTLFHMFSAAPAAPAVADDGEQPVRFADVLASVPLWHDLIADEAAVLRNTASTTSKALWKLRERSQIAIGLTGTPIDRGVDDLGRLLAWCRNDPDMFGGRKLSSLYDVTDDDGLDELTRAIGPLMFRAHKAELKVAGKIPTIESSMPELFPTVAEAQLAQAASTELKRAFDDLVTWMDMLSARDPDDPELAEVRESMKLAQRAWLGGTTIARQAASDPSSLLESVSAAVQLLEAQDLIGPALEDGGTKRKWAVDYCINAVKDGGAILIFTDFATVARSLIMDLDNVGLRVGGVLGGGGKGRDLAVRQFRNGEIDILVCTASGERGLNLQRATHLVHYDLPWSPTRVTQRTGRLERLGSENQTVEVVFPTMVGTIEQRVAAIVVSRAVEAMRVLDTARGVEAADTDLARSLGAVVKKVDAKWLGDSGSNQGRASTMLALTAALFDT
jgi:hypothetical protein